MSETGLLILLSRFSRPAALARHVERAVLFPALRRLEHEGFVRRQRDVYRLTRRGRRELELQRALGRTVAAALA